MASSDSERHTEEAAENKSDKQLKDRKFSWAKLHRVDSLNLEAGKVSNSAARHGSKADWRTILSLAFQSVGVIYGDIGTSPLYVYASTFTDKIGHKDDILGVLSLIIYTIILVPMTKYVFIVLWANDNGDGGAFALYSLVCRYAKVSLIPNQEPEDRELSHYNLELPSNQFRRAQKIRHNLEKSKFAKVFLVFVAILGTSMVIGDGVLTPCISVLSAVSGIKPLGQEAVVGISIAILVALFCAQRLGTDKVGYTFAPAICIWFLFISGIGLYNLFKYDVSVLRAFNPKYIIDYFKRNGTKGWMSLGGVFLCITGSEAMFADLGHFSVRSIQISFSCLVFPALLSAYSGQAAYLSKFPEDVENTFYASIPDPLYWPTFVVAVAAAIIASQAMISGTFSIVAQAQGLGCFPRVKVIHTSAKYEGQVYIPELNYFLMIACVLVTLSFKTTEKLGHAYGIAVVVAEIITTNMVTLVMLVIWKISIWWITLFYVVFFSIESTYFSAQLTKFTQGGYLPLAFSAVLVIIMGTWHYAQKLRYQFELNNKVSSEYVRDLANNPDIKRVPGIGLLYSELVQGIPPIFPHFVSNIPSVHSVIVLVSIKSIPISKVAVQERFLFRHVEPREYNVFRCVVRLGYKDQLGDTEDFENQLVEQLNEFIRHEHYILAADQQVITEGETVPPVSGQLVAGKSSRVHMEEDLQRHVDSRVSSTGSIRSMNTPAAQSNRSSSRIQTVSPNLPLLTLHFALFSSLSSFLTSTVPPMDSLTLICTAALLAAGGLYWFVCILGSAEVKGKRAVQLSGGSIEKENVQDNYKQYWSFFRRPKEIETADKVPAFVDTFYNLVTDIYEWGWGQSFHFSPSIPGKSHREATRIHEEMAVDLIGVKPGARILDAGCGVGGPMRAIAAHSRANVVGITINEYQVKRARMHNKKAGLDSLCEVVCGNFLQMPFPDNSFDGAYSIEATCHAPKLEEVYKEIYRVMKPGSLYVSYEWVTTELYKPEDPEHVEIIHGIERGDALPGLRSYKDIAEVAKKVGFEVVKEKDLSKPPSNPWWTRLKMGRIAYWRNHILVTILAFLGIAPKGTVDVHEMLFVTADYLSKGGEKGIFSPMHMILCRKPVE